MSEPMLQTKEWGAYDAEENYRCINKRAWQLMGPINPIDNGDHTRAESPSRRRPRQVGISPSFGLYSASTSAGQHQPQCRPLFCLNLGKSASAPVSASTQPRPQPVPVGPSSPALPIFAAPALPILTDLGSSSRPRFLLASPILAGLGLLMDSAIAPRWPPAQWRPQLQGGPSSIAAPVPKRSLPPKHSKSASSTRTRNRPSLLGPGVILLYSASIDRLHSRSQLTTPASASSTDASVSTDPTVGLLQ